MINNKVDLIIPTFNKLPRLKLMIQSLEKQTFKNYEVIFIDDGSTDGTGQYIQQSGFNFTFKYIFQKNKGRASARNLGLKSSNNEIVIFTDDDVILHPDFIKGHLDAIIENKCVSHGMIYELPFLKFFTDPAEPKIDSIKDRYSLLVESRITKEDIDNDFILTINKFKRLSSLELLIKELLTGKQGKCDWLSFTGGNIAAPRSWLLDLGGFDNNFSLNWGCEDIELGYRLFLNGKSFLYNNRAINYHMTHVRKNYQFEHEQSSQYFYSLYRDNNILLFQDFVNRKISWRKFLEVI
jgi:glycosyltransferase involved in cell wall biosynthesis